MGFVLTSGQVIGAKSMASLGHMPTPRPIGEDTVVDSPSEHRNEGEVAPPKEGVWAAKTNLFSAQVENVPFPLRCFMLLTAYFVLLKGAKFIYALTYSFTVMGKTKPF